MAANMKSPGSQTLYESLFYRQMTTSAVFIVTSLQFQDYVTCLDGFGIVSDAKETKEFKKWIDKGSGTLFKKKLKLKWAEELLYVHFQFSIYLRCCSIVTSVHGFKIRKQPPHMRIRLCTSNPP